MDKFPLWLINQFHERGWTQRDLARRAALSHATINKLVNGRDPDMRISTLVALIKVFRQSVEILQHLDIPLECDMKRLAAETREILAICENLAPEDRSYLLTVVRDLFQ